MNLETAEAKVLEAISLADNAGFSGTADALRAILPDFEVALLLNQSDRETSSEEKPVLPAEQLSLNVLLTNDTVPI